MCIVVENSLNVSLRVSKERNGTRKEGQEGIGEGRNRSRLSASIITRRHIIIHHPSLIIAMGEVCTQLPPTSLSHVRTRTRTHARTYARMHTQGRAHVFYERRGCVELVQGIFEIKKTSNRFRKHAGLKTQVK